MWLVGSSLTDMGASESKLFCVVQQDTFSSEEKGEACSAASAIAARPVGMLCPEARSAASLSSSSLTGVASSSLGLAAAGLLPMLGRSETLYARSEAHLLP